MPTALNTPIVQDGLERIPFFNGRVLTAEDLSAEQTADATERQRLGRALGTGVVDGLFVRKTSDETVTVEAGLGLAPNGQMVELPQTTEVSVVSSIEREKTTGTKGAFKDCAVQSATITTGTGAYLLVAESASTPEGRTPRTSLGGDGRVGECGAERRVEGARMRLVSLDASTMEPIDASLGERIQALAEDVESARAAGERPDPASVSRLRNLWAHVLLRGSVSSSAGGPSAAARAAPRSQLSMQEVTGSRAVPVGLVYWASDQIEFVDVWAARTVVRPPTDTERGAALSDRRLERYLQFVDHIGEVVASHPNPREIRLDNYVRFVPPVGMVAAFQVDAPQGVDPDRFLERYSRGTTGRKRSGPITNVLHRSFSYPPIDLDARPNLLRFRVGLASDTNPPGLFSRPILVYVHRDVGVASTTDGATIVFETARAVYRSLLEARAFEPAELQSTSQVEAMTTIRGDLRGLLERAGQGATRTAQGSDVAGTLDAFQHLYEEQIRVMERFRKDIEGIEEEGPRQRFAGDVEARLRQTGGSNLSATLKSALSDDDLVAAIDAQAAVNEYVGRWVGDTIATGPTTLQHVGSPDGDVLVPPGTEGAPSTFTYEFDLKNETDQRLTFQLSAQATAPTGDWTGSTTVRDAQGNETTTIKIDSATTETLTVDVTPPQGTTVGETATLTVRATVPAPNDRTMEETLQLPIEESTGPPTTHIIELSNLVVFNRNTLQPYALPNDPATTPIEIPTSDQIRIRVDATFTASADPTTGVDFDVTASLTIPSDGDGSPDEWPFDLFRDTTLIGSATDGTATGVVEDLSDGSSLRLKIDMNVPDTAGREAVVSLNVESSALQISDGTGDLRLRVVSS
ncbi:MAG: hypothetical protein V5A20_13060 [Salinibacter sp.]|uniref:COG1470 family protein n=1 Tax=Salinibacter sp. TaxID=2065818 RepID=UPI002FC39451